MLTRTEGNFKQRPLQGEMLHRKCDNPDHKNSVATEGKEEELRVQLLSSLNKTRC